MSWEVLLFLGQAVCAHRLMAFLLPVDSVQGLRIIFWI